MIVLDLAKQRQAYFMKQQLTASLRVAKYIGFSILAVLTRASSNSMLSCNMNLSSVLVEKDQEYELVFGTELGLACRYNDCPHFIH